MRWLLDNFHYFAGAWAFCLMLVILYFAIDAFREWRGTLKKLIVILATALAVIKWKKLVGFFQDSRVK